MNRRHCLAALLSALLLLGGCGEPAPTLSKLPLDGLILAFGDSLTHGTGAKAADSYPEVLASLTGREVVRSGVPGELSADGLARLPGVLEQHRPALVILCHGGNDLLRKQPLDRAAANLDAMIDLIRGAGAEVVLLGVPRPGLLLSDAPMYREVAERKAVVYEGDVIADVLADAGLKADPVHPNGKGYRRVAESLHELLRDAGAL